jgi:hypothetical protein
MIVLGFGLLVMKEHTPPRMELDAGERATGVRGSGTFRSSSD